MRLRTYLGASFSILLGKVADLVDRYLLVELRDIDLEGLDAEVHDELGPLPEFETEVLFVLSSDALRAVFQIAREEPNDDLALLTIQANADWTIREEDVEDWGPEAEA